METNFLVELIPGSFQLSFEIGSNLFGNGLQFSVGSVFNDAVIAPTFSVLELVNRDFDVTTATIARIVFQETGPLNTGGSIGSKEQPHWERIISAVFEEFADSDVTWSPGFRHRTSVIYGCHT